MPALFGNGRGQIAIAIIGLILCQAVAMGLSAFATRQIFNSLHLPTSAIPYWALACLLAAALFYAILHIATQSLSEKLGQAYAIDFRRKFYMHLSRLPASTLSERRVGALSIRFVGDLAAMRDWVSTGLTSLASAIIIVPAALFTLWLLQPQYLWVSAVPILALFLLMIWIAPKLKPIHRKLRSERANLAIDMTERAPMAHELRLLGRAKTDFKLLKRRGENLQNFAVSRTKYLTCLKVLPEIAAGIAAVLILWLTIESNDISAATAAAALAVIGIAIRPMIEVGRAWDIFCAWQIAREKSERVFNKGKLKRTRTGQRIETGPISYTLDSVKIANLPAITNTTPAGTITGLNYGHDDHHAIVNTLATLEDPLAGHIKINGIAVQDIALNTLPGLIHLISLNAPFIQGSLRRALTLATSKRPDGDTLLAQIKALGLNQLLLRLGGLNGRVWEGGRNLTDDEKFRVLLARAVLSEAPVFIIEDPGTDVSNAAKQILFNVIKSRQITGLLVSNDPLLLEQCDQVLSLVHNAQKTDDNRWIENNPA